MAILSSKRRFSLDGSIAVGQSEVQMVKAKRKWINTWPGHWNTYNGKTNVATIERMRGGFIWMDRTDSKPSWKIAATLDDAMAAAEAALLGARR